MATDIVIKCRICDKEKPYHSESTNLNVRAFIDETGWGRINIIAPKGKHESGWICDVCLKAILVKEKAKPHE